ncbi:MAG: hypothetical protein J1F68_01845 [Clostridiales bacterium]|nr:hypothetical protein [Clostridiales bacterium]
MKIRTKQFVSNLIQIVVLIAVAILLWYVAALIFDSELIVPEPWAVVKLTFTLLGDGAIYLALLNTLLRAICAFVVSVIVAVLLSMLVFLYPKCAFSVDCVVTFLRALPTIAIILVTLIVFNSTVVPAVVAFLVAFPIVYSVLSRAFKHNGNLLDVCKVYEVTAAKKIKFMFLPIVRDELLTIVAEELPLCIKVVIAGEVLALPFSGIGRQMYIGKVNLDTARVVALTLLTLVVCFAISGVISLCQARCTRRSR